MHVLETESAPRYQRPEGITSYLLASRRTCGASYLTTTLVEVEPGGSQRTHHHAPEQVYFIVTGSGQMSVADEVRTVEAGDCVFVPSGVAHGITNNGQHVLRYFSAAAPAFGADELTAIWPLASEREERGAIR